MPSTPLRAPLDGRKLLNLALVALGIATTAAAAAFTSSLGATAILGTAIQLLVALTVFRSADRAISLTCLAVAAWLAMFTIRMIQVSVSPNPLTDHPTVVNATSGTLRAVWILVTVGLVAFATGGRLANRLVPAGKVPEAPLSRLSVAVIFYGFLAGSLVLGLAHLGSGLVANALQLYLFAIAFAAYDSAAKKRPFGIELLAVVLASVLAVVFGNKELGVLPVVAWGIGHFAANRRILTPGLVGVIVLGAFFYLGVQSTRDAAALGDASGLVGATSRGLTEYDLTTGLRRHKVGLEIPLNAIAGVLTRVRGADSLFAIRARTPETVPFTRGQTLWQPAVSVVPGASWVLNLRYDQLALGRYFNVTFWTLRPGDDPSSQALTVPGDLYLNFGAAGLVVGLVLFGFVYRAVDRRFPVCSATSAGLFAYAAVPLLAIDRNFAYLLVTGLIRYGAGLLFIALLRNVVLHRAARDGGDQESATKKALRANGTDQGAVLA